MSITLPFTDVSDLENAVKRIHDRIGALVGHLTYDGSYLDELRSAGERGLFLHPETTEARQLASDAMLLDLLASALLAKRERLVANWATRLPKPKLDAAE